MAAVLRKVNNTTRILKRREKCQKRVKMEVVRDDKVTRIKTKSN